MAQKTKLILIRERRFRLEYYHYQYKVIQPRNKKYLIIDFVEKDNCIALYNFIAHSFTEKINTSLIGIMNSAFEKVFTCQSDREFVEGKYSDLDIRCNFTEIFDTYYECDPNESNKFSMYVDSRELQAMLQDYFSALRKFNSDPENYNTNEFEIKKIKKISF